MSVNTRIIGLLQGLYKVAPLGTAGSNLVDIGHDGTQGYIKSTSGFFILEATGARMFFYCLAGPRVEFGNSTVDYICVGSGAQFRWNSTGTPNNSGDTCLFRAAASVVGFGNGASSPLAGGYSSPANSPTSIAGNVNDFASGTGMFQRWTAGGAFSVTGMVAGVDGETRYIWNIGATNTITITNEDALSAAANRFHTSTAASLALAPNKAALAQYDTTTQRWRVTLLP
jgi:hypothetical protein